MKIFVTGGAGYIGFHTVVALLDAGHQVEIIDNYANSSASVLEQMCRDSWRWQAGLGK